MLQHNHLKSIQRVRGYLKYLDERVVEVPKQISSNLDNLEKLLCDDLKISPSREDEYPSFTYRQGRVSNNPEDYFTAIREHLNGLSSEIQRFIEIKSYGHSSPEALADQKKAIDKILGLIEDYYPKATLNSGNEQTHSGCNQSVKSEIEGFDPKNEIGNLSNDASPAAKSDANTDVLEECKDAPKLDCGTRPLASGSSVPKMPENSETPEPEYLDKSEHDAGSSLEDDHGTQGRFDDRVDRPAHDVSALPTPISENLPKRGIHNRVVEAYGQPKRTEESAPDEPNKLKCDFVGFQRADDFIIHNTSEGPDKSSLKQPLWKDLPDKFPCASEPIEPDSLLHLASVSGRAPTIVIGDIHGDRMALEAALQFIDEQQFPLDDPPCVVFLGDLIDRGEDSEGVFLRVMQYILESPERRHLIPGNHELSLHFNRDEQQFYSTLQPAEFVDQLNSFENEKKGYWADMFASLRSLPRAILLSNGLLAVHASIPHEDVIYDIQCFSDLSASKDSDSDRLAVTDLSWLRVHERAPKKFPNRLSKSCEIGIRQVEDGASYLSSLHSEHTIRGLVRGHDHFSDRFSDHSAKGAPIKILTVNTMGSLGERSISGDQQPCIALYSPSGEINIVKFSNLEKA